MPIAHKHAQMSIAVCGGGGGCSGTDHRQCQVWWQCGGIHVEQVGWWLGNQNRWQRLGDWWWKFFFFRISPRSVLHLSFEALPPTLHAKGSWTIQRMSFLRLWQFLDIFYQSIKFFVKSMLWSKWVNAILTPPEMVTISTWTLCYVLAVWQIGFHLFYYFNQTTCVSKGRDRQWQEGAVESPRRKRRQLPGFP